MKSCIVKGAICIILPMLRLYIHSDWFKYPSRFFMSAWSNAAPNDYSSFAMLVLLAV